MDFIVDFGKLLLIIVSVSLLVRLLKQPIILGYVISGILFALTQEGTGFNTDLIVVMSQLGIMFLLFLMGLEFDLKSLKYLGKDIFIVTVLQSAVLFAIGFFTAYFLGFRSFDCVYLAILFMFSSTLLVAKLLEDKKDTGTLYGRMTLGILIVQDLFAIIAITILNVVQEHDPAKIMLAPLGGIALLVVAFILAKFLLNWLLKFASKSSELLFLFSLGICFLFIEIAPFFGYSETIGAFIAGVTLANTIYKNEIIGKLKPLILFFNMLFFVGLGFLIKFDLRWEFFALIIAFTVLSLILKPIIFYLTIRLRGFDAKTSSVSGLNLAQLSEFGIIIIAAGVMNNLIMPEMNSIAVISVISTMVLSSYFIKYDSKIFSFFEPILIKIEKKWITKNFSLESGEKLDCNILFFGYYDIGKNIYNKLEGLGKKIVVIDNDPANIRLLKKGHIRFSYNSPRDPEFLERIDFSKIDLVVSSITDIDDTKNILKRLKSGNPKSVAIVTAKSVRDALNLYSSDADYVLYPTHVNEQQISVLIEDYTTDINKVLSKKIEDITRFRERDEEDKKSEDEMKFIDIEAFLSRVSEETKKIELGPKEFSAMWDWLGIKTTQTKKPKTDAKVSKKGKTKTD
jgi:Kef-type K+ transport system membrane component KefB